MSDFDLESKYGKFPGFGNESTEDYEESFMDYLSCEEISPYFEGFITKFGEIRFGEIENPSLSDFGSSF